MFSLRDLGLSHVLEGFFLLYFVFLKSFMILIFVFCQISIFRLTPVDDIGEFEVPFFYGYPIVSVPSLRILYVSVEVP